jgi:hypothetical protein
MGHHSPAVSTSAQRQAAGLAGFGKLLPPAFQRSVEKGGVHTGSESRGRVDASALPAPSPLPGEGRGGGWPQAPCLKTPTPTRPRKGEGS